MQQAITRHNGLVFYGLATASFLESAVPLHATALLGVFAGDQGVRHWIEQSWWPAKSAHARETRACVEMLWPEFDWSAAYGEFYESYRPLVTEGRVGRSPAREALACGVAAAQAAAFYRCLAAAVDDPELRELLHRLGGNEAAHFDCFRRVFERHERGDRLGWLKTYRAIRSCVTRARDVDVRLAFSRLNPLHWYGSAPFPEIGYRDFVQRMGQVARRHLKIGLAQRLLFRPWLQLRRLPATALSNAGPMRNGQPLAVAEMHIGFLAR